MIHTPHTSVVVRALIIKDKSVLCAYYPDDNHYSLPGGRVEAGESLLLALRRECKEELNIFIGNAQAIALLEHTFQKPVGKVYELTFYFSVKEPEMKYVSNEQGMEFRFVSLDDFEAISLRPVMAKRIITDVINKSNKHFYSTISNDN